MSDYYRVLGLPPAATVEQVKAAYRRRAVRHHPDKNAGCKDAEELFKNCSEAYATLVDPERRAAYDARLLTGRGPRELVHEALEELLGGVYRRRRRGADLRHTIELTLEQSAVAQRRELRLLNDELCSSCGGRGSTPAGQEQCRECDGRGVFQRGGLLTLPRVCPRCAGRGVRIVRPCPDCDGVGMRERVRRVTVALSAGLPNGHVEVLRGQGAPGVHGGPAGDLHLVVKIRQHPFFRPRGIHLELDLPVNIGLAALGGAVSVPTLGGNVRMQIPVGTQSGTIFRVRGKGLPAGAERGDLLVNVVVETPVALDERGRELLRLFEAQGAERMYPRQSALAQQVEQPADASDVPCSAAPVSESPAGYARGGETGGG